MSMPSELVENPPRGMPASPSGCRISARVSAETSFNVAECSRIQDQQDQLSEDKGKAIQPPDVVFQSAEVSNAVQQPGRYGFFSRELAPERREYMAIVIRPVFMVILLMWLCLPVFWGALANAPAYTSNLEAWFINRDASRIGNTLWESFNNASTPGMRLGWINVDPAVAGLDEDIANAIVQNKAWVAVIVEANATLRLVHARANGDATYDPRSAMTVYYAQARHEVAVGTYLLPNLNSLLSSTVTAYATGSAQRYFAQITPGSTVNQTAVQLLAQAPQTISPGVSWRMINLRPFSDPTAQAVTLVGNIYLIIFAFIATTAHVSARAVIAHRLSYRSYFLLRVVVPLIMYFPLSLSYALVSVAYNLPFDGKFTYGGGFMLSLMYFYLGMAALGLAVEAMVTVLTVRYSPYFLFVLIIFNVAPTLLPPQLMHPFYNYGAGFPILNLSLALRTILFDTRSDLARNAGVMVAWIALSCLTITLFSWFMRRREFEGFAQVHHAPLTSSSHKSNGALQVLKTTSENKGKADHVMEKVSSVKNAV